jgi:hypothetical protein
VLEEVYGWACETKWICAERSGLLDKWNKGFVLEEAYGWACETKDLFLKKCIGACENKGFVLEEVCIVGKFGWGVLVKGIKAFAPATLCWLHRGNKRR